jgi:hypothetical protein
MQALRTLGKEYLDGQLVTLRTLQKVMQLRVPMLVDEYKRNSIPIFQFWKDSFDLNYSTLIPHSPSYNHSDLTNRKMSTEPQPTFIHDVIIIGAGPCGLAVAARLGEETPSAVFTDEEHQRYHWIKKHTGRMNLVQARHSKMNGVRANKWNRETMCPCDSKDKDHDRQRRASTDSVSSVPSLSNSSTASTSSSMSTLVLDGSGNKWMQRWNNAFKTLEIKQLRSPMFFHVDPGDRDGMLAYTQETGREKDLWEIPNCVGKEVSKHKKKKRRQGGKNQ